MIPKQTDAKSPLALVFWIIWFSILNGLVLIQYFVGGGIPKGEDQGNPPVMFLALAGVLALVAMGIRFVLIPRIKDLPKKLPAMIIGLALSEGVGFVGIFALGNKFPATQLLLFGCAVGCILCFAPFYAKPFVDKGHFR